jgi:hypothetical protein
MSIDSRVKLSSGFKKQRRQVNNTISTGSWAQCSGLKGNDDKWITLYCLWSEFRNIEECLLLGIVLDTELFK